MATVACLRCRSAKRTSNTISTAGWGMTDTPFERMLEEAAGDFLSPPIHLCQCLCLCLCWCFDLCLCGRMHTSKNCLAFSRFANSLPRLDASLRDDQSPPRGEGSGCLWYGELSEGGWPSGSPTPTLCALEGCTWPAFIVSDLGALAAAPAVLIILEGCMLPMNGSASADFAGAGEGAGAFAGSKTCRSIASSSSSSSPITSPSASIPPVPL